MSVNVVGRKQVPGVGPDGETLRVYTREDGEKAASVTAILGLGEWDETGLENWKAKHDGEGDAADWRHILWFTANRGTLAHYAALNPLADRELWSDDEEESAIELLDPRGRGMKDDLAEVIEAASVEDLAYSVLREEGDVVSRQHFDDTVDVDRFWLSRRVREDVWKFLDVFDEVAEEIGLVDGEILDVERYLFSETWKFAGQSDLVYRSALDGAVVAADLKTSAGLQEKNKLQIAAYGAAYEENTGTTVDRHEVVRIKPRRSSDVHVPRSEAYASDVLPTSDVHSFEHWSEPPHLLWRAFRTLCARLDLSVGGEGE